MERPDKCRSLFCVLNNPQKLFGDDMPPELMVEKVIEMWTVKTTRACAVNYEIADTGTPHMHMVLEDSNQSRFSAIQKLFPGMHIEPTKGNRKQAKDYIEKKGKHTEKDHTVVVPAQYYGDIEGNQGKRNDLLDIENMVLSGMKPNEIMNLSINYRKHETLINKTYFAKRYAETPRVRDVKVYWHVGDSGSGKSYSYVHLCEQHGDDDVYLMTDYGNGGFDKYQGERILFMDEFKGAMPFHQLLTYLDVYRVQIHARYANSYALWEEVHITSVFAPEQVYKSMVEREQRDVDTIKQLLRRLTAVIYHFHEDGQYHQIEIPIEEYKDIETFKDKYGISFVKVDDDEQIPFLP